MSFSITSNFNGKYINNWVATTLYKSVSINHFQPLTNVKQTANIPNLAIGNFFQADSCDWTASGTTTLTEYTVTVCDIKANIPLCKTDLEAHWESEFMKAGAMNSDIPSSLQDFIVERVSKQTADNIEFYIWQGDVTGSTYPLCDGILKKFSADTDVIEVKATKLTSSNIIDQINSVYDEIPGNVINESDLKIFVSPATAKLYKQAIAAASAEAYYVGDKPLDFLGIEIVEAPGMPNNKMVAGRESNLWFATDLMSDFSDLKIIDTTETLGDDNVRLKMRFKFGVSYKNSDEFVFYGKS